MISETPWPIDSCPMTGSFLTLTKRGLAAAWETKNQIHFTVFDEKAKGKPKEIRATAKGRYPVVVAASDGSKLLAWKNDTTLEWQLFGSDSVPKGKPGSIANAGQHRPAGVLTRSGSFVLFP